MVDPTPSHASAAEKYRKLPGRVGGVLSTSRLWLGRDHLLSATTSFGVERYRRFYLKDMEALVVQRTKRRAIWNAVLGGLGGLFVAVAVAIWFGTREGGAAAPFSFAELGVPLIILGAVAIFFLLLALINTLRGQTCALFSQTASGLSRLDAPVRMRAAQRLIARLVPEIEAAQGSGTAPERQSAIA